jgi:hypothetical protein
MAARYQRRYGAASIVVHRGLAGPVQPSPAGVARDAGALEVGVMGNTYGYEQLLVLGAAVEAGARALSLAPRITIIGGGPGERLRADLAGRVEVEVTGHLDEARAVDRLARCFALYLNYPFGRLASVLRQTSFPTKLSSYLLAARPLLVHAPRESSIADLEQHPGYVGWWGSERVDEGREILLRLWRTPAAHESQHATAERLRLQYYDLDANRDALFAALERLGGP